MFIPSPELISNILKMQRTVFQCVSPARSQRHLEQRFGQSQLLLPHSVGQDLSVRIMSVGLVAELKQLPDSHTQRPETKHSMDIVVKHKTVIRTSMCSSACVDRFDLIPQLFKKCILLSLYIPSQVLLFLLCCQVFCCCVCLSYHMLLCGV